MSNGKRTLCERAIKLARTKTCFGTKSLTAAKRNLLMEPLIRIVLAGRHNPNAMVSELKVSAR